MMSMGTKSIRKLSKENYNFMIFNRPFHLTVAEIVKNYLFILFLLTFSITNAQHFGQSDHPMNKNTDDRMILEYWGEKSQKVTELYDSAYKVFSDNKNATYVDLLDDIPFRRICDKYDVVKLGGPMLGDVTSEGVSVWMRTVWPSKVEVEVIGDDFKKLFGPVYSRPETDLTAVVNVKGLQPSKKYQYRVYVDDSLVEIPENASFRTAPASADQSVRIGFGSCTHRWGLGNEKLFGQIRNRKPRAFLMPGDVAVQDCNNHLGMHRAEYLLRDFHPAWKKFAASIPVYATWDDHDYFDNDEAGIPEGYTNADRKNVREVYRYAWNNPMYGFEDKNEGIFLRTRIGPADIIMVDNRYFRKDEREKHAFLGEEQMQWLKEQLLDCKGPFIILSCGTMWSDYVSDGKDSWGVYDPEGREEIFRLIEENNIGGVLLISGDRHGARGFTIPRESGFRFYEFGAASLGARVGPPATRPEWDNQLYGIDGRFAFGEFTFFTSRPDPKVVFRLIGEDGEIIYKLRLKRSQLTPS